MTVVVPVVRRTADSADFFDAARQGRLLLRACARCGTHRGPQERVCSACFAVEHELVLASGRATLVSWAVVHRSPVPVLPAPYVAGLVEVEEGPWLLTRVLAAPTERLEVGQRLCIFVADGVEDGEAVVLSRTELAGESAAGGSEEAQR